MKKGVSSGTLESNDIYIIGMSREDDRIEVEVESTVKEEYGEIIKEVILGKLKELEVKGIDIKADDKGALDYTIRARVETLIERYRR